MMTKTQMSPLPIMRLPAPPTQGFHGENLSGKTPQPTTIATATAVLEKK